MSFRLEDIAGLRVTVMGLGLHGGGTASARFFASRGADVTVTDLRTEAELSSSMEQLRDFPVRYVLGRHEYEDFRSADMVIKNPGVPGTSPYLLAAKRVETDISVFLRLVDPPLLAVTGTKGKSTTVSALHYILQDLYPGVRLGGNITISPLAFIDELPSSESGTPPVILELSSWQLADLRGMDVLHPEISCITNILYDHQNRYSRFEDYVEDKKEIYRGQRRNGVSLFLYDDYGRSFGAEREKEGEVLYFADGPLPKGLEGGWLRADGGGVLRRRGTVLELLPPDAELPGRHNRLNLLCAGIMALLGGADSGTVRRRAAAFKGIPHRLEYAGEAAGVRFYNDSAATIPEAVVSAVRSFPGECVLITGGTDKELIFTPYETIARKPAAIVLLSGSGTEKIIPILKNQGVEYSGPYEDLGRACRKALEFSRPGGVVLFSPGCASFEYFRNEFHRGDAFKEAVRGLKKTV